MIENKYERVEPESPLRCQATHGNLQCPFKITGDYDPESQRYSGSRYCPRHGGNLAVNQKSRLYLLAKYKSRIEQLTDSEQAKTLREELGILRMLLEEKMNRYNDDELLMRSGSIVELVREITKTLQACTKIDRMIGLTLDRDQAFAFAQDVLNIVTEFVPDPNRLEEIAFRMAEALKNRSSNT